MGWTGILFILLLVVLFLGFYLGVPTNWGKHRKGKDLNPGGRNGLRPHHRERELH